MKSSEYSAMFQLEGTHWWFLSKRKFIQTFFPHRTQSRTILDIGCGTGGTTQFLEQFGSVIGVERNPLAIKLTKSRKINIIESNGENIPLTKNSKDIVTFFDVLYHKNIHPEAALREAYRILKPGGFLIITDCALPGYWSAHDEIMQARERFTETRLRSLVTNAGFIIDRSSYIFFFTFPLFLLQRWLYNYIYKPKECVSTLPSFLNSFLLIVTALEAYLLHFIAFPIGSSLIMRAQKPKSERKQRAKGNLP